MLCEIIASVFSLFGCHVKNISNNKKDDPLNIPSNPLKCLKILSSSVLGDAFLLKWVSEEPPNITQWISNVRVK